MNICVRSDFKTSILSSCQVGTQKPGADPENSQVPGEGRLAAKHEGEVEGGSCKQVMTTHRDTGEYRQNAKSYMTRWGFRFPLSFPSIFSRFSIIGKARHLMANDSIKVIALVNVS